MFTGQLGRDKLHHIRVPCFLVRVTAQPSLPLTLHPNRPSLPCRHPTTTKALTAKRVQSTPLPAGRNVIRKTDASEEKTESICYDGSGVVRTRHTRCPQHRQMLPADKGKPGSGRRRGASCSVPGLWTVLRPRASWCQHRRQTQPNSYPVWQLPPPVSSVRRPPGGGGSFHGLLSQVFVGSGENGSVSWGTPAGITAGHNVI